MAVAISAGAAWATSPDLAIVVGRRTAAQRSASSGEAPRRTTGGYAGPELFDSPDQAHRDALRDQISATSPALVGGGTSTRRRDGVRSSPLDRPVCDADTLGNVHSDIDEPVVTEVLQFEDRPLGSAGSRRAIERWSDGTETVAVICYSDEVLFTAAATARQDTLGSWRTCQEATGDQDLKDDRCSSSIHHHSHIRRLCEMVR